MSEAERVVLVDDQGDPIGTAQKSSVHGNDTPLHLAFSCHVLDGAGRVLVTRRALSKKTWPGVWTNSFCGHPRPEESFADAIARHASHELGLALTDLQEELPTFRYRATDAGGVVENEICPVYTARTAGEPRLHPDEVVDAQWVEPAALARALTAAPWAFSPWLVLQARELALFAPGNRR